MKSRKFYFAAALLMAFGALNIGAADNSNKISIFHYTGSGWQILTIGENARAAHAGHGDQWFSTRCPLTGDEHACEQE